nr:hypothetical protein [Glycomyces dulcitolivorans]
MDDAFGARRISVGAFGIAGAAGGGRRDGEGAGRLGQVGEEALDLGVGAGLVGLPGALGELVEVEAALLGGGVEAGDDGLALGVRDAEVRVLRVHALVSSGAMGSHLLVGPGLSRRGRLTRPPLHHSW